MTGSLIPRVTIPRPSGTRSGETYAFRGVRWHLEPADQILRAIAETENFAMVATGPCDRQSAVAGLRFRLWVPLEGRDRSYVSQEG